MTDASPSPAPSPGPDSAAAIQGRIDAIRADDSHPVNDKFHPSHQQALTEWEDLHRQVVAAQDLEAGTAHQADVTAVTPEAVTAYLASDMLQLPEGFAWKPPVVAQGWQRAVEFGATHDHVQALLAAVAAARRDGRTYTPEQGRQAAAMYGDGHAERVEAVLEIAEDGLELRDLVAELRGLKDDPVVGRAIAEFYQPWLAHPKVRAWYFEEETA